MHFIMLDNQKPLEAKTRDNKIIKQPVKASVQITPMITLLSNKVHILDEDVYARLTSVHFDDSGKIESITYRHPSDGLFASTKIDNVRFVFGMV